MIPTIEIDGNIYKYTGFYDLQDCIGGVQCGIITGFDEKTTKEAQVRIFVPSSFSNVGAINIYKENSDGSIDGIRGLYRNAHWATDDYGKPKLCLSERIC